MKQERMKVTVFMGMLGTLCFSPLAWAQSPVQMKSEKVEDQKVSPSQMAQGQAADKAMLGAMTAQAAVINNGQAAQLSVAQSVKPLVAVSFSPPLPPVKPPKEPSLLDRIVAWLLQGIGPH